MIGLKTKAKTQPPELSEDYIQAAGEMLRHPLVRKMAQFRHHGRTSCLDHCLAVSYRSFIWALRIGLDANSAARAGLLHDFYLYDWHTEHPVPGWHGYTHPRTALRHANAHFQISKTEAESILCHMWPLTLRLPRGRLAWLICLVDKYCAIEEILRRQNFRWKHTDMQSLAD